VSGLKAEGKVGCQKLEAALVESALPVLKTSHHVILSDADPSVAREAESKDPENAHNSKCSLRAFRSLQIGR
jgi:hypothetical protein